MCVWERMFFYRKKFFVGNFRGEKYKYNAILMYFGVITCLPAQWYVCLGRRKYQYGRPIVIYDFERAQRKANFSKYLLIPTYIALYIIYLCVSVCVCLQYSRYFLFWDRVSYETFQSYFDFPSRMHNSCKDLVVWFVGYQGKFSINFWSRIPVAARYISTASNSLWNITI